MAVFAVQIIAEGEFQERGDFVKWSLHVQHDVLDGNERPVPASVGIDLFGPGVMFHASRDSVDIHIPLPVLEEMAAALPKLREEAARLEDEFYAGVARAVAEERGDL